MPNPRVVLIISLVAALAGTGMAKAQTNFNQFNLVSDGAVTAVITDPNLVNAWGISESPMSPFWISDNGTGLATLYSVPGSPPPAPVSVVPLVVTIPPATGATTSAPTGQVFNSVGGFDLKNGNGQPAIFMFASEDGAITGWNGGTKAVIAVDNGNADPSKNAVYKGLAISNFGGGSLYATNFRADQVETYSSSGFSLVNTSTDPGVPAGYAPFGDRVINGELYVTFALQDSFKHDDVKGLGNGFVDIFNLDGSFNRRLISQGNLDSPWGLALAPASFGDFGGDLLVGNFGNGMINAYNPDTGAFIGTLNGADGNPLSIDGLWGLTFGNGAAGGSLDTLYFTAGPNGENDGLFGALTPVPEPSTWAMMGLGFATLGLAGYRRARKARLAPTTV